MRLDYECLYPATTSDILDEFLESGEECAKLDTDGEDYLVVANRFRGLIRYKDDLYLDKVHVRTHNNNVYLVRGKSPYVRSR